MNINLFINAVHSASEIVLGVVGLHGKVLAMLLFLSPAFPLCACV